MKPDKSTEGIKINGNSLVILGWKLVKLIFSSIAAIIGLFYPDRRGEVPAPNNPILFKSATTLIKEIKSGKLKSEDVLKAYIERINQINPIINAVIDERFGDALEEARLVDTKVHKYLSGDQSVKDDVENKALLGLPFTCKDSMAVTGMLQSAGYFFRKGVRAEEDAPAVSQMRRAGAIPIAITNVPEILLWWDSRNLIYGLTRNPYDLNRISGGSSGGEGALITSCGSIMGLGSDLGGSIRIPSNFCGIFGHKPSPGAVSLVGMWPAVNEAFKKFATFGPMGRYASDLRLVLDVMAFESERKMLKLNEEVDLRDIKIFWSDTEGGNPLCNPLSPEIRDVMIKAIEHLRLKFEVPVERVTFPRMIYSMHMWAACIKKDDSRNVRDMLGEGTPSGMPVNVVWELLKSIFGLSNHTFNLLWMSLVQDIGGFKRKSRAFDFFIKQAEILREEVNKTIGPDGILIFPTMPEEAPKINTTAFKGVDVAYCGLMNVLGLPSTHVPMGLNSNGLPIGFQVISTAYNDRITLAVAEELEKNFVCYQPPFQKSL